MTDPQNFDQGHGEPIQLPRSAAEEATPGECPVVVLPDGSWAVRGHADVLQVATSPELYASGGRRHRHIPNSLDGEEHRRFRALVDVHLDDSRILPLMPMIREVSDRLASDLTQRTHLEVVQDFGRHVAVQVQCRWLGWPDDLQETLLRWIDDNFAASRSGDPQRNTEIAERFDRIVSDIVEARRALEASGEQLPQDPTTALMHESVEDPQAREGRRPLTHAELVSLLRNWTAGDLGSIAASIGVVVHHVAADRAEQDRLRALARDEAAHTEELDAAVDEMLRINDPFPTNRRVTTEETVLAGHRAPAGTVVAINWTAANRDERVFGDPDAYRPERNREANIVYGAGPHVCPGRVLSTLQIRGALAALLRATSSIALDPDRPPVRYPWPSRGFDTVPVLLS